MAASSTPRQLRDALRSLVVTHGGLEETKRPCGAELSAPHAYALLELLSAEQPLTVSQLAERLLIDRTNVSRLCARMEDDDELRRELDPSDARAWRMQLTAKGKKLARRVDARSAEHFARVQAELPDTAPQVLEALRQLTDAMRRSAATKTPASKE